MFDYLQKFNNLPNTLRDKVSSPTAMRAVLALELKYKVDLAALVMKVMTKTLSIKDLPEYLMNEFSLSQADALALKAEILKEILAPVSEYLTLDETKNEINKSPEIGEFFSVLINEAGLSLPSEDLYLRLKNIMLTFLKGVRSKIDTKNSLMKKVEFGGLGLAQEEADRVVKLFEKHEQEKENLVRKTEEQISAPQKLEKNSREKLDQIIMAAETNSSQVYDLKKSLAVSRDKTQTLEVKKELERDILPKEAEQILLPLEEEEALLPLAKERLQLQEKLDLKNKDGNIQGHSQGVVIGAKSEAKPEIKPEARPEVKSELKPEAKPVVKSEIKPVVEPGLKPDIKAETEKSMIKQGDIKKDLKQENKEKREDKKNKEKEEDKEDYVAAKTLNLNFKRPAPTLSKPRMEDIKPVAKAMDPIDELAFLDLTNFRRLSSNADEAVLKIFNRIKLLEKDGYDKMVAGVKAWRQNEVNRLYIKIGQEALMKNLPLKEAIVERQKRNMPYLKIEEINAISKLNGRLSF